MDAPSFGMVFTTVPSPEEGDRIASALVGEGLAACVTQLPGAVSTYVWDGRTMREQEVLLLIKTRTGLFHALEERIRSLHPYEVPEVVLLPFHSGSAAYLRWMDSVLTASGG